MSEQPVEKLPLFKMLRLSSFQIGSAMSDILTASVWNRVMISDLGMPATPVGLLLALQYLLLPISFWAGHRSDTKPLWGKRRVSYIWFGRALMVLSFPLLGLSVREIELGQVTAGWLVAVASFTLFGVGKLFSGSVYLALVRESAPPTKRGIAIGLAETMLIAFFPIAAVGYGRWMEAYEAQTFALMILITAVICAFFWFFAVLGVEKRAAVETAVSASQAGSWQDVISKFNSIWHDPRVRRFFAFLFIATFAAWMQDNILEPFGADVFGLPAGQTTRFTGYWGTATILVLLACFVIWRKTPPQKHAPITKIGLIIMATGKLGIVLLALTDQVHFLIPALLVFGTGFGFYTFGGLSLMAVMSPNRDAGAYLGLWSVCILVSKGLGTFAGGALRDLFFLVSGLPVALSYALSFGLAACGLLLAAAVLSGPQLIDFAQETEPTLETADLQVISAD